MTKEQLQMPLPVRTARGREDFFVSESNALAVALVEGWQNWPAMKMVLSGQPGSGKTHLAHVWAALSGAQIVAAKDLPHQDIPALAATPVVVEDIDEIAGDRDIEEILFHLHNMALAQGNALMLTGAQPPNHWPLSIPDLKSRMMGAQAASLTGPDDRLLAAILVKLFADRQIVPTMDVIPYLLRQMPRSYGAAKGIVEALDKAALGRSGGVNRPLAVQVMAQLAQER